MRGYLIYFDDSIFLKIGRIISSFGFGFFPPKTTPIISRTRQEEEESSSGFRSTT